VITHNQYLGQLVEYGLIGFVLFIMGLGQLWWRTYFLVRNNKREFTNVVSLSLLTSWMVMIFFENCDSARTWWFVLGIVSANIFMNKEETLNKIKPIPLAQ